MEMGAAGLHLGRSRQEAGIAEGHWGRRECWVCSQHGAPTGLRQAGLCPRAVIVRRVVSEHALIQALCGVLLAPLVGSPRLPVEHLGKQRRAWEMLLKALPEGDRGLVVTLTVLQPSRLPQARRSLLMGGKILR